MGVAASKGNMQQKAYTYLQLARIEYEALENFEMSKAYYDSALTILPQEAPEYRLVADRKRALDNFVTQYTIVSTEDSLQRLAKMNPAQLDNKIDQIIEAKEKKRIEEEEKARKAQIAAQNASLQQGGGNPLVAGGERRFERIARRAVFRARQIGAEADIDATLGHGSLDLTQNRS